MPPGTTLPPAEAHAFGDLVTFTEHGIASRVLAKVGPSNVTIFAFAKGQALSEHTAPFDAMVLVLEGSMTLTIAGKPVKAAAGTITRMPAGIPHAVDADEQSRMLLVMLREPKAA